MNKRSPNKKAAYEQAISFRKRGFSYAEIAKICAVSRSTVHAWLSGQEFSQAVSVANKKRAAAQNRERIRLINKARVNERASQYDAVVRLAETEFKHYVHSPLFVAGLMLYSSEGDIQHPRLIRLANSRPELHAVFMRFMTEFMGVERKQVRFWLLLYPDLDETACMKHWMKKVGLSAAQFHKNQYVEGRSRKPTLHFGVGNTIIGSVLLKKKLTRWTELVFKELKK